MPTAALRALQSSRLRTVVERAYEHVALFRERMGARGVTPREIGGVDDIARLPLTVKNDLRDTYPFGLLASPMREVVRLHASSGTTGKPIVVAYSQADLEGVDQRNASRTLAGYGLHAGDVAAERLRLRAFYRRFGHSLRGRGPGRDSHSDLRRQYTDRQIMVMKDFGVSAICCTPSYFLHILDRAEEMGVDLRDLPLRAGCFGAEPWTDGMRRRIEAAAGIKAFDVYGLTEIIGPGVGAECPLQDGLHIFEDHFYPEIIDPETLEPLPDGQEGELVLTTLSKQAMPMIRYRTRDITSIIAGRVCACGRTSAASAAFRTAATTCSSSAA